jgi:hypothetical protein
MFHIPKLALDEIAEDAGAQKISTLQAPDGWRTHDPVVGRLQDYILDALASPDQSSRLLQDHVMLGLGAHFAQAYGGMTKSTPHQGGLAPWQESRAKEFIAANFGARYCRRVRAVAGAFFTRLQDICRHDPAQLAADGPDQTGQGSAADRKT